MKTLVIMSFESVPEAATGPSGTVVYPLSSIKKWLAETSPAEVENAGFAYGHAASSIEYACDAITRNAAKLAEDRVWHGFASVEVQEALRKLHATGTELASKMEMMSTTLRLYGGTYLPQAREQVAGLTPPPEGMSNQLAGTAMESKDTRAGREAMTELNKKIVELYDTYMPRTVSYDLDIPQPPEGSASPAKKVNPYADTTPPSNGSIHRGSAVAGDSGGSNGFASYPGADRSGSGAGGAGGGSNLEGSGSNGSGSNGSGPNGSGSGGSGSGGPGSGSDGPGGSGPDGPGPDGSGPDGPGADGPGSDGSAGSGSDGSDGTAEDGVGDGSDQGPESPPTDANGTGTDQDMGDDETVDSVIGGNNDALADDPRSTEVENFTPPPVTGALPHLPTPIAGPLGVPSALGTPSGLVVPPVLGGPGFGAGTAGMGEAASVMARGATATSGMPMMPMMPMGGGGVGGEGGQVSETPYGLSEDHDVWKCDDDVTSSTITQSV
ncbi:hypothetical protein [Streptosporangium lutulentum]|uniref:Uncharacterized protein YukE n=1 Tax=Streptosporangium lutulentum TaxID=1461250 RepID=A0ABT9QSM1_9ACTN|nr:hypothetical protein [Streptosporangium lutulentum]MDP9849396.1 uncharacterized protein YukE [Streptosporangium lutulentum]